MVYVDIKKDSSILYDRIILDDTDIEVSNIKEINHDNWGDDDCIKMVTTVSAIDIKIKATAVSKLTKVSDILMIRFNYYQPAYHLNCSMQSCEKLPDGSLLLKYT